MLIKCIECGKEISDKSESCPNCGCPTKFSIEKLEKLNKTKEDEKINNQDKIFYECPVCRIKYPEGTIECSVCGYHAIKIISDEFKEKYNQTSNTPTCPKCGSTAITAGQRGYTLMSGFLGSNKTVNRCVNCGYTWKPGK